MEIPLLDLSSQYRFVKKGIEKNLQKCLSSQQWVLGPMVSEFEKKVAAYLKVKYALGVASGTDALTIALRSLALVFKKSSFFNPKNEIITTPFTFVATGEAIKRAGATPVFADIDSFSFNLCPKAVEKAITKNTVGILPVHLYGQACAMAEIRKIAKKNNLFVLEDCAQSFGAFYSQPNRQAKKLGSLSQAAAFSFFPSKNLGGFGDGGLVVTNNKKIAEFVQILRGHGQVAQYQADYSGYNSRLDSIQAAVLLAKLNYADLMNKKRIKIAARYNQAFKSIPGLELPENKGQNLTAPSHVYHLYTLKVPAAKRNKLLNYLQAKKIAARIYYPVSLTKMKAFAGARISGSLQNTRQALKQVISLPLYPFIPETKINYLIKTVKAFFAA